ncbi:MAG: carboxypeptidase regulatory-like domain-containing protein [Bacteroidales bacterium]|nr:carboxypeptidase regulatory-like domain-containing protein [Bacteroidales bacterium]
MKTKRRVIFSLLAFMAMTQGILVAQHPDWQLKTSITKNSPEAEMVIRVGDIDNFGFDFEEGYNPFSGEPTDPHGFPWEPDPADPDGTDRIMVVSGFKGDPSASTDGYTQSTSRPENSVRPIVFSFPTEGIAVNAASLQLFVDDFQAPVFKTKFTATVNGIRFAELEKVLNSLNQTGPVGKLVTVTFHPEMLEAVRRGKVSILIDDAVTGAGDGYAIDFARILINPKASGNRKISGKVSDKTTGKPLEGATVSSSGIVKAITTSEGVYTLTGVPGGFNYVTASKTGYASSMTTVEVSDSKAGTLNFQLEAVAEPVITDTVKPVPQVVYDKVDDWKKKRVIMKNTPDAELMVRVGDIDNINSGFAQGYNPFSGELTEWNEFPWEVDKTDPEGTDRIMVPSSYKYGSEAWTDGYTETSLRPGNLPKPVTLEFQPVDITINSAILQAFINDIQSVSSESLFTAKLDGVMSVGLSKLINETDMTGPVGKMVSYRLTPEEVGKLKDGKFKILIDDATTGIGDGFAIDFVRILINPKPHVKASK